MSKFREMVKKILKEMNEFNSGDIVALKMNSDKIVNTLGEKHGRLYYNVSYPAAIGAYIGNYKFGWINKPIPADQLIKSSEEALNQKIDEIKLKYECK